VDRGLSAARGSATGLSERGLSLVISACSAHLNTFVPTPPLGEIGDGLGLLIWGNRDMVKQKYQSLSDIADAFLMVPCEGLHS